MTLLIPLGSRPELPNIESNDFVKTTFIAFENRMDEADYRVASVSQKVLKTIILPGEEILITRDVGEVA